MPEVKDKIARGSSLKFTKVWVVESKRYDFRRYRLYKRYFE